MDRLPSPCLSRVSAHAVFPPRRGCTQVPPLGPVSVSSLPPTHLSFLGSPGPHLPSCHAPCGALASTSGFYQGTGLSLLSLCPWWPVQLWPETRAGAATALRLFEVFSLLLLKVECTFLSPGHPAAPLPPRAGFLVDTAGRSLAG